MDEETADPSDEEMLQMLAEYNRHKEYQQMLDEGYCEHGIHPDSGRTCVECVINARND
jgi:hypothetical protein